MAASKFKLSQILDCMPPSSPVSIADCRSSFPAGRVTLYAFPYFPASNRVASTGISLSHPARAKCHGVGVPDTRVESCYELVAGAQGKESAPQGCPRACPRGKRGAEYIMLTDRYTVRLSTRTGRVLHPCTTRMFLTERKTCQLHFLLQSINFLPDI